MKKMLCVLAFLLCASGARAQDMIPVNQITFVGGPSDIGSWPVTAAITRVTFTPAGTGVQFTKDALPVNRGGTGWPDTCVPIDTCKETGVDMGALQYSFGVVLKVNGQWFASAPVESWYQRMNPGGPINDQSVVCPSGSGQLHCNWFYAQDRWPGIYNARPQTGEQIGIFVVAGDARNNFNPLRERSNIVVLDLPPTGVDLAFDFGAFVPPPPVFLPPAPIPVPPVVAPPVPAPAPLPSNELGQLFTQSAINHAAEMAVLSELQNQVAALKQDVADFRAAVRSKWIAIVDSPVFKYALAGLTGFLATHKWGG